MNTVQFILKNVGFLSYKLFYGQNRVFAKYNIESNNPDVDRTGHPLPYRAPHVYNDLDHEFECYRDHEYWLKTEEHDWRYVTDNLETRHLSEEFVNTCVDEKYNGQFIVMGDSHLRFEYFYMETHIRGHHKPKDYQVVKEKLDFLVMIEKSSFHMSTYKHVFLKHLKWLFLNPPEKILDMRDRNDFSSYLRGNTSSEYVRRPSKRKALLLLDSGTWDVAFNDSAIYIANFHTIKHILHKLKMQGNYEIIWQNIPTWASTMEHNGFRHTNTFINGAVNAWTMKQLTELNIPLVNIWKMALPFQDKSIHPCGCHYLCQDKGKWLGYPGAEAAHTVFRIACP